MRTEDYYKIFIDKYYRPALEKRKEILDYSSKLESIEKSGLFTPIVLPVLSFYTDKWVFQRRTPSLEIRKEINELLNFLYNIATKREYEAEIGEEPPLSYHGNYLRVSVVLVARKELAETLDYIPHFEMAKEKLRSGVDILFIAGRGRNNSALAEIVALKLKGEPFCQQINGASKFYFCPEEGRKIEGVCYAFKRKV